MTTPVKSSPMSPENVDRNTITQLEKYDESRAFELEQSKIPKTAFKTEERKLTFAEKNALKLKEI